VSRVVVVGAGRGGLTTAALLARAGVEVTVLEAHVYPGGCAGTYFHRGYRFDAGATLAGGFAPGGPLAHLAELLDLSWPIHFPDPAMVVHLPGGLRVRRWASAGRWSDERRAVFGGTAEPFWRWQERTADSLWRLAQELLPWPPQSLGESAQLGAALLRARPSPLLALDAFRPVAARLSGANEQARLFVDAQLLIAAQTTSQRANALYGAAALDLPRRGVAHLSGGMGAIAETLVKNVRRSGGRVLYRHEASRVVQEHGRPVAVETTRGEVFAADLVILNLPPRNVADLLGPAAPAGPRNPPAFPRDGWGAFALHVGLDGAAIGPDFPLHHQVVVREPLGEGNSVFLSLSPAWDERRAPPGQRALTISTHTRPGPWWALLERDPAGYQARKALYADRLLSAAELALPGLRRSARVVLPATPVTFHRYTRRSGGWVGGFPQSSLFRAQAPRLAPLLWQVGDSIFPGQSTAAVVLGGMRVARAVLGELGLDSRVSLAASRGERALAAADRREAA
jgi:C-3',4' desaturase CrtD